MLDDLLCNRAMHGNVMWCTTMITFHHTDLPVLYIAMHQVNCWGLELRITKCNTVSKNPLILIFIPVGEQLDV